MSTRVYFEIGLNNEIRSILCNILYFQCTFANKDYNQMNNYNYRLLYPKPIFIRYIKEINI